MPATNSTRCSLIPILSETEVVRHNMEECTSGATSFRDHSNKSSTSSPVCATIFSRARDPGYLNFKVATGLVPMLARGILLEDRSTCNMQYFGDLPLRIYFYLHDLYLSACKTDAYLLPADLRERDRHWTPRSTPSATPLSISAFGSRAQSYCTPFHTLDDIATLGIESLASNMALPPLIVRESSMNQFTPSVSSVL